MKRDESNGETLMRKKWTTCTALATCATVAATFLSTAVLAEANPVGKKAVFEEILTTAQRREESLQDVPLAVSVLSGNLVEDSRILNIDDISQRVPGMYFIDVSGSGGSFIVMRGTGSTSDVPAIDRPVVMFIDEIYFGGAEGLVPDVFDIERVEILRGPQGTTFGRNVTGGAVHFITRKPSFEPSARMEVSGYSGTGFDARGMFTGPLIADKVAAKVSVSAQNSDGQARNLFDGKNLDGTDRLSGRFQLLFTPTESLNILLGADYTADRSNGHAANLIASSGDGPTLLPPLVSGPDVVDMNQPGGQNRDLWGLLLNVGWDTSIGTFTSITGYRDVDTFYVEDLDATSVKFDLQRLIADTEQWTQELRWNGEVGQLQYLAGVYYFRNETNRREWIDIDVLPGSFLNLLIPSPVVLDQRQSVRTRSVAAYGELKYHITDQVAVTAGVRYTSDNKKGEVQQLSDPNPFNCQAGCPAFVDFDRSWNAWTPRFILEYSPTDNVMLYASASRGFKSGGVSVLMDPGPFPLFIKPEFVWNYELGAKTSWFDNRLIANATVYQLDYKDLQTPIFMVTQFVTVSLDTRSIGADLELMARPIPNLDLSLTYGYLKAEERGTERTLPYSPKHMISAGASYTHELAGDRGNIVLGGEFQYRGKVFFDPANTEPLSLLKQTKVDSLINLRLAYESPNGWSVSGWVKNLTDEKIVNSTFNFTSFVLTAAERAAGERIDRVVYADGRTIGLTFRWEM